MYHLNGKEFSGKLVFPDDAIYEVIRVRDGHLLFYEDHMERLRKNLEENNLIEFFLPMEKAIDLFPKREEEFSLIILIDKLKKDIYASKLEVDEKTDEERLEGVAVGLYDYERTKPKNKIYRKKFKEDTKRIMENESLFELLLVNENKITEGSRSNFFYFLNGKLYTPPKKGVLPGITKKHLLKLLAENDIALEERQLLVSEIDQIESAFLSGTGMYVTNVNSICDKKLPKQNLSRDIVKLFHDYISKCL